MRGLPAREPALARRFGKRIAALRKSTGLSQAEVGRAVGLTPGSIRKIERGETFPGDRILAFATLFRVEVADLFVEGKGRPRGVAARRAALLKQIAEAVRLLEALGDE